MDSWEKVLLKWRSNTTCKIWAYMYKNVEGFIMKRNAGSTKVR